MYYAKIHHENKTHLVELTKPTKISRILHNTDLHVNMPCAGTGTCGKCTVKVTGELSPMEKTERLLLKESDIEDNIRLACYAIAEGNVEIFLETDEISAVSYTKEFDIDLSYKGFGIATDIGTTTVVTRLYNRETGKVLGENTAQNAQRAFGADVISRIECCNSDGVEKLAKLIRNQVSHMASELMTEHKVDTLEEVVICGNTTMLHIFEELEPRSLAVAPFNIMSNFGDKSKHLIQNSPVFLPHCIGAYIGADTVCAVLSSGMLDNNECNLLIDIGTNGEMALSKDGKILCTSTAAGPAFEGAGLYMGMNALNGAISKLWVENGEIKHETIGNEEAEGICGSGIVDALSVMLQVGAVDETGAFDEDSGFEFIEIEGHTAFKIPNTEVLVTQADIRQIQLAKSAICAGLLTLMDSTGVTFDDIDNLYIAGGFGHHLDRQSAANIGLIPEELVSKSSVIGNAALGGASMMLLSKDCRNNKRIDDFAELSLSESAFFMDSYVDNMFFPV